MQNVKPPETTHAVHARQIYFHNLAYEIRQFMSFYCNIDPPVVLHFTLIYMYLPLLAAPHPPHPYPSQSGISVNKLNLSN